MVNKASGSRDPAAVAIGPELDHESETDVRLGVLVGRYDLMLRNYLRSLARSRDLADDLAQQLWLKLLEAARAGRLLPADETALRSYLFTAARNLFLDECVRRHGASRTSVQDPGAIETLVASGERGCEPSAADLVERQDSTAAIHAAVSRLSPPQRTVIQLWMCDHSIHEMAAATGAPRDTVLSRKKYALQHLRSALESLG